MPIRHMGRRGASIQKKKAEHKKKAATKKAAHKGPLPVTLLSGFLGAGKTTLLQHILHSEHGLRIAVVVNDIGAVNVDANLIKHKVTQTDEKVVAMQNGCICCTLRGDLLEELVKLKKMNEFDYIIIESSGISEPEQVAETFDVNLGDYMAQMADDEVDESLATALKEIQAAGGVGKFAMLDTTVTVIDAHTMFNDFDTAELLSSRRDDVTEEDERTVSDLMVDQIEFANVIVLNKIDMVSAEEKAKILDVIVSLNPDAKIIETVKGKVNPKEIVNTKKFDLKKAQHGYGWLQDLHNMTRREINGRNVITPKPETEEYNVRNFVYVRRRPFHPERIYGLIYDKFITQLDDLQDADEDDEDEDGDHEERTSSDKDRKASDASRNIHQGDVASRSSPDEMIVDGPESDDAISVASAGQSVDSQKLSESTAGTAPSTPTKADSKDADETMDDSVSDASDDVDFEKDFPPVDNDTILANRRAHSVFKDLLRSKGGFWMATRPNFRANWSQAGAMLTIAADMPFFCTMDPEEYKTEDGEVDQLLQHDIESGGEWGDRRQELVFIGVKLQKEKLSGLLDECLLNDDEWEQWQQIMRDDALDYQEKHEALEDIFRDGWPDWPMMYDYGEEENHDHDGHDHSHGHGHSHSHGKASRSISQYHEEMEELD